MTCRHADSQFSSRLLSSRQARLPQSAGQALKIIEQKTTATYHRYPVSPLCCEDTRLGPG